MLRHRLDFSGKGSSNINVQLRLKVHPSGGIHEINVRDAGGGRLSRFDVGHARHGEALVHDRARDGVIRVVVISPVAEHHVRSGDTEGVDECEAGLAGIEKKLVVESQPNEFGSKHRGSRLCLLVSNCGDFSRGNGGRPHIAVSGHAEKQSVPAVAVPCGGTSCEGFDVIRMCADKEYVHIVIVIGWWQMDNSRRGKE